MIVDIWLGKLLLAQSALVSIEQIELSLCDEDFIDQVRELLVLKDRLLPALISIKITFRNATFIPGLEWNDLIKEFSDANISLMVKEVFVFNANSPLLRLYYPRMMESGNEGVV